VLACALLAPLWAARREGLDPRRVRASLLILAVVALAGGRLHFVANHPAFYVDGWARALLPTGGGFHIGGGIVAMALLAPWVTRRLGVPLGKFGDALVLPVGLAIMVARLGCFLHGCCVGDVCQGPWCIAYPAGSGVFGVQLDQHLIPPNAAWSLPVLPLHLYFLAAGLAVVCLGYWLEPRKRYDGQVALFGLLLFSTSTAALELLRAADGSSPLWGPLPQLVWTGIGMSVASFSGLVVAEVVYARRAAASVSGPAVAAGG
jgi:phosphatidylglycerol:prolipoprotein diacylglycerol transferase